MNYSMNNSIAVVLLRCFYRIALAHGQNQRLSLVENKPKCNCNYYNNALEAAVRTIRVVL